MMPALTASRLHKRPINSHDSFAFETPQGFRECQKSGGLSLAETDDAEICSRFRRTNGHHSIIFYQALEMSIRPRGLPKCVDLGPAAFFDHDPKPRCLYLEQFHRVQKKSARELRQGGSDYRCCIPALAGFVSPQSIAPDGDKLFAKDRRDATDFSPDRLQSVSLTADCRFVWIAQ